MIKTFLLTLSILFTFIACNSSSDNSKSDINNTHIVFTLDTDKLHSMSSSSYKVYDTNLSKEITDESYIYIIDTNIAYYKNRRIYAQNSGETLLNVYHKGIKSSFSLVVSDANILYIQASSDTYSLHKKFTSSLTCKAFFDDYTSQDITYDVSWLSSDEERATISSYRLKGLKPGNVDVTAKYKDKSSFFTTKILPATMDSLLLSEDTLTLHEKTFHQFYARAHFSDGTDEDITKDVTWSSNTIQVAQITTDALMYTQHYGKSNIEAKIDNFTQTVAVDVLKSPSTNLQIVLPNDKIRFFKHKDQDIPSYGCFKLLVDFDDGLKQLVSRAAKWTSSDLNTLYIDDKGCYKTLKEGNVNIEANFDNTKVTQSIHVDKTEIVSLQLYSPISSLNEGLSTSLQSRAIDKENNYYKVNSESFWHSSNQEIVSVTNTKENSGQILARKSGISTVKSVFGSLYAYIDVTVGTTALKELRIIPEISESVPKGYKQKLKVYGYFIDGSSQELTQSVFFKSTQEHIASISNNLTDKGYLEALSKGETLISASYGAITASFSLNVEDPEVVSLSIDAPQTSIQRSKSMKIKAYATYSDGTKRNFTNVVTWSTYPYSIATVSNEGNFYAVNIGKVYVTARYEDISTSRIFEVIEPKILSVIIQELANHVDVHKSINLRAYIDYNDGRRDEATRKVEWVSFNEDIASVEDNGTVTGISVGEAKIKALYQGHTDATTITVFKSEQNLTIESNSTNINIADDLQLSAALRYSDNSVEYVSFSTAWSSSDTSILSVDDHGVIHGISSGTATITANYHDFTDTKSITVH